MNEDTEKAIRALDRERARAKKLEDDLALAVGVIEAIRDLANQGKTITITDDWGGNSLTVAITGLGHTHVGLDDGSVTQLIESMHDRLVEGRGLSFVTPEVT